jgi:hypothetical protein
LFGLDYNALQSDGQLPIGDFGFADWTDLNFGVFGFWLYLVPDRLEGLQTPIDVHLEAAQMAPGDTVKVIVKHRETDGSLTAYGSDALFNVRIIEGGEHAGLLSRSARNHGGTPQKSLENTTQGFALVSTDTMSVDSVHVKIYVTKCSEIISSSILPLQPPGKMQKMAIRQATAPSKLAGLISAAPGSMLRPKNLHNPKGGVNALSRTGAPLLAASHASLQGSTPAQAQKHQ